MTTTPLTDLTTATAAFDAASTSHTESKRDVTVAATQFIATAAASSWPTAVAVTMTDSDQGDYLTLDGVTLADGTEVDTWDDPGWGTFADATEHAASYIYDWIGSVPVPGFVWEKDRRGNTASARITIADALPTVTAPAPTLPAQDVTVLSEDHVDAITNHVAALRAEADAATARAAALRVQANTAALRAYVLTHDDDADLIEYVDDDHHADTHHLSFSSGSDDVMDLLRGADTEDFPGNVLDGVGSDGWGPLAYRADRAVLLADYDAAGVAIANADSTRDLFTAAGGSTARITDHLLLQPHEVAAGMAFPDAYPFVAKSAEQADPFTCSGCGRPEGDCSTDPCDAVLVDRRA